MYRKPVIMDTSDLAEGVYAASGSGNVTVTKGTANTWSGGGNFNFSVAIPASYAGQHTKMTITFDRPITGAWGMDGSQASGTVSGNTATYEMWNTQTSGTLTVSANQTDVNFAGSASITKV